MKNRLMKIMSGILIAAFLMTAGPLGGITAFAAEPAPQGVYTLSNDYVTIAVSGKNGGFAVDTVEGSKLIKSDNNKRLLYHSGEYDTSFASFQVTYPGNTVKEYVFGGNYSFLGLGGNNLTTVQDAASITSTWTVDDLTFTQRVQLANVGSNEHGMVILSYRVQSARNDTVTVSQRLLLDSALGDRDYAVYEITDRNNTPHRIEKEQVVEAQEDIPLAFFGYDDPDAPGIVAYTVNSSSAMPYKAAFAHWNNLAATAFDFTANPDLTFTNKNNILYQTADSAYALYYHMGTVAPGGEGSPVSTNYGVYSNKEASEAGRVAVNVTSPLSLELSADRKTYQKTDPSLPGSATFSIQAQIDNYTSEKAKDYAKVTVAFYTANGITPLDSSGRELLPAPTYNAPFTIDITDFTVGETQTSTFLFKADVGASSAYRKVEMVVFDTGSPVPGGGSSLLQENVIGSHTFYVLCPGGDGALPAVTFTGKKPDILYYKGTRHLYITGSNLEFLSGDKSQYSLCAYNTANPSVNYVIDSNNIMFPEENVMDAIFTEEMVPGTYELRFQLTEAFAQALGCGRVLTAPALTVIMSDSGEYQTINYGIVAVVQKGLQANAKYSINSYKTEASFNQDKGSYDDILLVLRGDFVKEDDGSGGHRYKAAVGERGENLVTINNCMDFQGGMISVYHHYENGKAKSIYVDFDGSLYTSVAKTSIWKGKAAFTGIADGQDYGLVPYNKNGVRLKNFTESSLTLIWPNLMGLEQTLAGLIFKFTYGTLGVMYDTTVGDKSMLSPTTPVLGNTLSFSAALDLSFIVPKSQLAKDDSRTINAGTELYWISQDPGGELRGLWNHYMNESKKPAPKGKENAPGQAKVLVDDILFGCGKGFLGVNFTVDVGLPAYVEAMPSIQGKLTVNTVGNWSFGVQGKCQFTTITLEVDLRIKSYNNIPIPDKLYLYVEGFEPGVNIDGFGVMWITGGGGGFDNLYDTIFMSDGVPPLKLMLSVAFDLFKALEARADLSLSLRGIGLSVSGVKIKKTDIPVLNKLALQFDWYPHIYFMASVDAYFYYGVIRGQGYIVVIDNEQYHGFFEAFVRGALFIPKAIPFIGGMELARVDFGLNSQKVWGAASIIGGIGVSVVYYWGGDASVSLKKNPAAQPTFPELLGCEDIPVGYDVETGRTLYMTFGSNLTLAAAAAIEEDSGTMPRLLNASDGLLSVESDADKEEHVVYVPYNGKKYVYTASFHAESLAEAQAIAGGFVIRDRTTKAAFPLELYDPGDPDDPSDGNLSTANANLSYNEATKTASLGVTLTRHTAGLDDFDTEWEILTTGHSTDIVLFEVGSIPEMTALNGSISGGTLSATWDGAGLGDLDSVSFYLTGNATGEEAGDLIATINTQGAIESKSGSFTLPADLPSGNYYLRAVYSREDSVNGVKVSDTAISYSNPDQPTDPGSVIIANSGDLAFDAALSGNIDPTDADGYLASVYEATSQGLVATDITNMNFDRDDQGVLPPITIGGSYQGMDANGNPTVHGLVAGKTYRVGVTAYNYVDADSDGDDDYMVYGNEVLSNSAVLNAVTPPDVTINALTPFTTVTTREWQQGPGGSAVQMDVTSDVFKAQDVSFAIDADVPVSGGWSLDGITDIPGYFADFTNTTGFEIALSGLSEGSHTLDVSGTDADGDSFRETRVFTVDTQGPKLLLTSPVNGSRFAGDGRLRVEGITDFDARFTIEADGAVLAASRTISQLSGAIDADGVFAFEANVDPGVSAHHIVITAKDAVGNATSAEADVQNAGLSNIQRLSVYADGVQYTNENLRLASSGSTTATMQLVAETGSSSFVLNDPGLIYWEAQTVNGSAGITDDGVLTVAPGSTGFVTGGFRVAEGAAMTASFTFGAEIYSQAMSSYSTLTLGATVGGSVSGAGRYMEGQTVEIVATPDAGYRFTGWTVQGNASVGDRLAARTTVTIPQEDVTIIANFEYINPTDNGPGPGPGTGTDTNTDIDTDNGIMPPVTAKAGEKVSVPIPEGVDGNDIAVCVMVDGVERTVPWSMAKDGNLVFKAPADGQYYFKEVKAEFSDIGKHWAKESMESAFVRGLFNGVGNGLFDPDSSMTRSMFVTVLGRLQGIDPAQYGGSSFKDVQEGEWYAPYVEWAYRNNIVTGVGAGAFDTDRAVTRQEMCVIMVRYLKFAGYSLKEVNEGIIFGDDDQISDWAKDATGFAQRMGLMNGIGNNLFNPGGSATRAEVATVFIRLIQKVLESM